MLLSLILVVGSVFAFLYLRDQYNANLEQSILNATEFHEGVTIGGVDVSGMSPEEAKQDLEGMQTMYTLGCNMAWLMKCIAAGAAAGLTPPASERGNVTNFIR